MSFIGIYFHNLDAKNRLFIPVKYRDDLGEKFVVMPGPHGNLWLYPTDVFEGIAEQYRKTHTLEEQSNFFSSVSNGSVDNQGRLNIEPRYKEHANLIKEVVLSGGGKRVEVWPIENFRPGKVELKDAQLADETFTVLMGEKVEPRREFIEKNAKYVVNLDV